MPNTYTIISSTVLATTAASITFSSIPATYTDLVIRYSARCDRAGVNSQNFYMQINNTSFISDYSFTKITGVSTTAASSRNSNDGAFYPDEVNAAVSTANTFNNGEVYIPNYALTRNKSISTFSVLENDSAGSNYLVASANLYSLTTAVSSIIFSLPTGNFISGTSFYLYGIKNS
jgi:hypothetical protein